MPKHILLWLAIERHFVARRIAVSSSQNLHSSMSDNIILIKIDNGSYRDPKNCQILQCQSLKWTFWSYSVLADFLKILALPFSKNLFYFHAAKWFRISKRRLVSLFGKYVGFFISLDFYIKNLDWRDLISLGCLIEFTVALSNQY